MNQITKLSSTNDRQIVIGDKPVEFPHPVAEMLEFPETVVVRLEVPPKSGLNENVFGINYNGKLVWQIPQQEHIREDSPYTGINREKDNKVGCYNWDATLYIVNSTTGEIVSKEFLK
jgi:hypothetical protein